MDQPKICRIKRIIEENPLTRTYFLDCNVKIAPGQFLMLWIPEVDEKPFVCSYSGKETGLTVEKKGKFTEKLFTMKKGDLVGIRGPYGNGFTKRKMQLLSAED